MSESINLSIIIPAYKEADMIGPSLERLSTFLAERPNFGNVEVIVLSDGDESSGKAAEAHAHSFKHLRAIYPDGRLGKGGAVRRGMLEAKGKYRLFMDADLATPLRHLDDVQKLIEKDAKVIIAVRNLFKIHKSFSRKIVSKTANIIVQMVVLPGIKDSQCGFKAFEAEAAESIFRRQTMTSWSFDVEILAIARSLKYKIHTIEAPDWKDPKADAGGLAGESALKVALKQATDPLKVRLNLIRGRYKIPTYTKTF